MTIKKDFFPIISKIKLFSTLSNDVLSRLLSDRRCCILNYSSGDCIFGEKEFKSAVGVVGLGTAEITRIGGGNKVSLNCISVGDIFGVATMFGEDSGYITEITAKEPCEILFIPREVIHELIVTEPTFSLSFIGFLSDKIRFLNKRICELTASGVQRKLAKYLIGAESDTVESMTQLASSLGIGRASLYRELDELESKGIIKKTGRSVKITDRDRLISLAN